VSGAGEGEVVSKKVGKEVSLRGGRGATWQESTSQFTASALNKLSSSSSSLLLLL